MFGYVKKEKVLQLIESRRKVYENIMKDYDIRIVSMMDKIDPEVYELIERYGIRMERVIDFDLIGMIKDDDVRSVILARNYWCERCAAAEYLSHEIKFSI